MSLSATATTSPNLRSKTSTPQSFSLQTFDPETQNFERPSSSASDPSDRAILSGRQGGNALKRNWPILLVSLLGILGTGGFAGAWGLEKNAGAAVGNRIKDLETKNNGLRSNLTETQIELGDVLGRLHTKENDLVTLCIQPAIRNANPKPCRDYLAVTGSSNESLGNGRLEKRASLNEVV